MKEEGLSYKGASEFLSLADGHLQAPEAGEQPDPT